MGTGDFSTYKRVHLPTAVMLSVTECVGGGTKRYYYTKLFNLTQFSLFFFNADAKQKDHLTQF